MYKVENIKTTLAEIERQARSPEHAEMRRRVIEEMERVDNISLVFAKEKRNSR